MTKLEGEGVGAIVVECQFLSIGRFRPYPAMSCAEITNELHLDARGHLGFMVRRLKNCAKLCGFKEKAGLTKKRKERRKVSGGAL